MSRTTGTPSVDARDEDRARSTIVVLGAPPGAGPALAPPLRARVATAAAVYLEARAARVLVSGIRNARLDETGPMRDALLALGVDAHALLVDEKGVRTLTSLVRARDLFDVERAIVVTNAFHMPRALLLARALGLDVEGAIAREDPLPRRRRRAWRVAREVGALSRAVVDVAVLKLVEQGRAPRAQRRADRPS